MVPPPASWLVRRRSFPFVPSTGCQRPGNHRRIIVRRAEIKRHVPRKAVIAGPIFKTADWPSSALATFPLGFLKVGITSGLMVPSVPASDAPHRWSRALAALRHGRSPQSLKNNSLSGPADFSLGIVLHERGPPFRAGMTHPAH
jgi:hypothetical protein